MFDFLKPDSTARALVDDQFRESFEDQKKSEGKVYSLTKTDGIYNDPAIQKEWVEFVEFEKLKMTAW